jgi:hypothetical protein
MKTKIKLLSLVLGIAFSSVLFTQCVKNEESDGVRAVREGYASKLLADADYQKASAEKIRAEAEKLKLEAEWNAKKAEAEVEGKKLENQLKEIDIKIHEIDIKIKELELEREKWLLEKEKDEYQAGLEAQLAEYAAEIAKYEADLAQENLRKEQIEADLKALQNTILEAQRAHEIAMLESDAALVVAQQALAEAQAKFLANNPKLAEYQKLYDSLFVSPNYYAKKTGLLKDKLEKESSILELKYSSNADHLAWLFRDSLKAAQNLSYTLQLLAKYEALDGQTVEQLQAKADDAEIEWQQAQAVVAEKELIQQEKENVYDTENAKLTTENSKLSTLYDKLNGYSVQLLVLDSLYSLNSYSSPTVYPAPISSLVYSVHQSTLYGYKRILARATGRLAYLKSELLSSQPTGFGYTTSPSDYEPTKKYLEEKIKHIENELLPVVDRLISEQDAKVQEADSKLATGKEAWSSANTAYKNAVTGLNVTTATLRSQLLAWKKAATDSLTKGTTKNLSTGQRSAFFDAIQKYYEARYEFDRFVATNGLLAYIPKTSAGLKDEDAFNATDFFDADAGVVGANEWGLQLSVISALENESNVKIVNDYEWKNFDGTPGGNVYVSWPSVSTDPYASSILGALLYQSRNVYGASDIIDIHYFLLYDTKPTETVNGKSPVFSYYYSSLFYALQTAKGDLTTLVESKEKAFYVENYKTVLALVNRTIAYYEDLATEYGELVAKTEAEFAAQTDVVNAQAKVLQAAYEAYLEADAAVVTATTYANNLEGIYDLLKEANASSTLAIIKGKIAELENKINNPATGKGLIKDVEKANKALANYRASGDTDGGDIIADQIKALEAEIADIEAQIKALEAIINGIEAQMAELLKSAEE